MSYSQQQITNACQQLYVGKVFHQHNVAFKIEGFSPVSGKVSVKNLNTEEYREINCWDIPEIATAFFADDNVQKNNAYYRNNGIEDNHSFGLSLSSYDIDVWKSIFKLDNNISIEQLKNYLFQLSVIELEYRDDITELPESIGMLHSLQKLYLKSRISFAELPESIFLLKNLKELHIQLLDNEIIIPKRIEQLSNLKTLVLGEHVRKIPESICKLNDLQTLDIEGIEELPENIGQLRNLQSLRIESYCIKTLPESICQLYNLQELHLLCGNLTELPNNIGQLHNLQELYLQCENLTELPNNIGQLHNLQELYLERCNSISKLPESIGRLHHLQKLSLSGCHSIEDISIYHLTKLNHLEYLNLELCPRLNRIPDNVLPNCIIHQDSFKFIDKVFNKIEDHVIESIEQGKEDRLSMRLIRKIFDI